MLPPQQHKVPTPYWATPPFSCNLGNDVFCIFCCTYCYRSQRKFNQLEITSLEIAWNRVGSWIIATACIVAWIRRSLASYRIGQQKVQSMFWWIFLETKTPFYTGISLVNEWGEHVPPDRRRQHANNFELESFQTHLSDRHQVLTYFRRSNDDWNFRCSHRSKNYSTVVTFTSAT